MVERIQKIIANAGYCSRRKAEVLIEKGAVLLNGNIAKLGDKAGGIDEIIVNGEKIKRDIKKYYCILNKPKGILVTKDDPEGRKTIYDLDSVKKLTQKIGKTLNYVGRLDGMTEGLLILTNDGDLTNLLTHPSKHAKKVYSLRVEPKLSAADIKKIEKGVEIDERPLVGVISGVNDNVFNLMIGEGRNRIVRRVMEKLGYKIYMLKRVSVENVRLGDLEVGEVREIEEKDIEKLNKRLE
jgi:23S rRNA pseudouridine2605 synthase